MSGLLITDLTTAEAHVSACGGVPFVDAPGNDFEYPAATGTDCVTAQVNNYDINDFFGQPAGNITLPAYRVAFLADALTDTANTPLESHTPNVGGTWTNIQALGDIKINPSGSIQNANASDSIDYNDAPPPGPDYLVEATFRKPTGSTGAAGIRIRQQAGANTAYRLYYDGIADQFTLDKVIAGAVTTLATYAISLTPDTNVPCNITAVGTTLTATIAGASQAPVTDATITTAGFAGVEIFQSALVQPSPILRQIDAF